MFSTLWRGGGAAERAGFENRSARKGSGSSNLPLSVRNSRTFLKAEHGAPCVVFRRAPSVQVCPGLPLQFANCSAREKCGPVPIRTSEPHSLFYRTEQFMNDPNQARPDSVGAFAPSAVNTSHITAWKPELDDCPAAKPGTDLLRRATLRATREAIRPYPAASGVDNGQGIADQQRSAFAPAAARRGRKPKASPSIFRDAARALIKPKSGPKAGDKIAFEPDDTPADAEQVLGRNSTPISPVKRGPVPRT